ncbi:hypothetical protein JOF28_000124 [Leucobacter exalbidus]|uniref:Lipoprotein n=1 Tax=Leucobacter exalbidus TaxID=662960 RepID=A0A940PJ92_9MICO|nr:hypothetical protein [Leucobacter exalbidus]MBP1324892.1 hypothetical protein [Leucobacter exalbidus]
MNKKYRALSRIFLVAGALLLGGSLSGCIAIGSVSQTTTEDGGSSSSAEREITPAPVPRESKQDEARPEVQQKVTESNCLDGTERRRLQLNGSQDSAVWVGDIVEPHGASYRLRTVLKDDGCLISGSFEYQGLNCSGIWEAPKIVEMSEPSNEPQTIRVHFVERVNHNPDGACADVAEVSILSGPGGMFYSSTWARDDGEVTASRTLLQPE